MASAFSLIEESNRSPKMVADTGLWRAASVISLLKPVLIAVSLRLRTVASAIYPVMVLWMANRIHWTAAIDCLASPTRLQFSSHLIASLHPNRRKLRHDQLVVQLLDDRFAVVEATEVRLGSSIS